MKPLFLVVLGDPADWHHPSWPGKMVTTYMSYFTTGVPGEELGTNKLPRTGRIQDRSKGERRLQSICSNNLPESSSLQSILAKWYVHHQERTLSQNDWLQNPETNPITIKPETLSHVAEQFSWVPLPSCSLPGRPYPIKSLLCQHMCLIGQLISEC